jgi:hypothetical protein
MKVRRAVLPIKYAPIVLFQVGYSSTPAPVIEV